MKFRAVGAALTLAGLLLAIAPAMAHHEILAKFDDNKPITLKGIVTLVDWANPHVHVFLNVATGKELVNWAIESRVRSISSRAAGPLTHCSRATRSRCRA